MTAALAHVTTERIVPVLVHASLRLLLLTGLLASSLTTPAPATPDTRWTPPRDNPRFTVFDMPDDVISGRLGVSPEEMRSRRAQVPAQARGDTGIVCVLLCQWANHPADTSLHPVEAYETLLFSTDEVCPGSMRDYFTEVSYGTYFVTGDIHGWLTQPDYAVDLWFTDFFAAADPFIDFSRYDRDGDGYTDAVWVFHAGPGQEETHDPADIWSYAVWGLGYATDDGVIIDRYSCNPEEHSDGSIITIRVAAHEASHVLGLPDLYDYDAKLDVTTYYTPGDRNDHPLVDWCLMGYGGYNIMSYGTRQDPSHLCAWSKDQLGFVTPIVLTSPMHRIPVPEVETNPVVYKISSPGAGPQEYFLIENRNTASTVAKFDHLDSDFSAYFDWFTPGQNQKDPGLLILHVDNAVSSNSAGPGNPHYKVIVEDAGYDPARPWDGVSEFSEWWYPYEFRIGATFAAEDTGQTAFTPVSYPSSAWYGSPSGVWITNISASGPLMTFDLGFGNAWPAITAHVPSSLDTALAMGEVLVFSVTAVDPNGDALSYEWTAYGGLTQDCVDSTFSYTPPFEGARDTIRVVASDGELSDSLAWVVQCGAVSGDPSFPVPTQATLSAAPTPFGTSVTLTCAIPTAGPARVTIHDLAGNLVSVIAEGYMTAGVSSWTWRATGPTGGAVPRGAYLVRLLGEGFTARSLIVYTR
ncbi:M6 family metalloprotease domain-containing protein [Candidatus Fermentibacteria bacterium]|nr:M6 family metalloprotease domain-containing protein [Candidatus Fermentibacteria bacterium]